MDRPTVTHAISGCHVILTCIKVIQSQLPREGNPEAPSPLTRSVVLVVFGLAGAFVGGAAGSVWGALVANLIAIGVAWHQLQAAQQGHVLAASD